MRRTGVVLFLLCLSLAHGQTVTQTELHSLPQPSPTDGGFTVAYVLQAADQSFYGFADNPGLLFSFTTAGGYDLISNPSVPKFGTNMIQGPDGRFYGPSADGDNIVAMTTLGKITAYSMPFDISSQQYPDGNDVVGLTLGSDGNFYGVAAEGGSAPTNGGEDPGYGAVFRMTPKGAFSLIYSFTDGTDGANPEQILLQGSDGNFYGSTNSGASLGHGTLFRLTPQGSLTTLHDFGSGDYPPINPMVEMSNGLYGIHDFVTDDQDVLYKINSAGTYSAFLTEPDGESGNGLGTALTLGSDGNLYAAAGDTVFQITPAGAENTYYTEADETESPFQANIVQGSDGNLYGAYGYIGQLSQSPALPPPVQVALNASAVMPGTSVTASVKVLNAFSLTLQQCYAFQNGTPLGKVPGAYSSSTKLYTFSTSFTPTTPGAYNYAVTCGGIESGYATLQVGYPTTITLTATPQTVTPPGNVQLAATVARTGSNGVPTGTVTFYYETLALGSATLNGSGVATLSASSSGVAAGSYAITAQYSGDAEDAASTSAASAVTVE